MAGKIAKSGPPGNKHAQTHGLTVLKHAVNGLGNRMVDRRTVTGKALVKWRADLIQDLGDDVSTQQSALVDLCVKSKLLLDSVDAWLLVQPSLVNARKKSLLPVVRERQQLADGLSALSRTARDEWQTERNRARTVGRGNGDEEVEQRNSL